MTNLLKVTPLRGIDEIETIIKVGSDICESIAKAKAAGDPWKLTDFTRDVLPDLILAIDHSPDLPGELIDMDTAELVVIIDDLTELAVKIINLLIKK